MDLRTLLLSCAVPVAAPRDRTISFTVLPTMLDSITPPQFMFSRLHLSSPPPLATVLRHLLTLTRGDRTQEKWNHEQASIFIDIFSFLQGKTHSSRVRVKIMLTFHRKVNNIASLRQFIETYCIGHSKVKIWMLDSFKRRPTS